MKSLCIFLLEAWYFDVRKNVPATVSRRVNAGIRSFSNNSSEVQETVILAKKSGAAKDAKRRRGSVKRALYYGRMHGGNIVHVPCRKAKK